MGVARQHHHGDGRRALLTLGFSKNLKELKPTQAGHQHIEINHGEW
jgi:hypothetical protein